MKKKISKDDEHFMSLALAEAARAEGQTSPNPMVGALLVKNGKILAKGYHRRAGLPHAEIEALRKVKSAKGATLYVTLEPCCHLGKRTPPCTDALLQSGLKRVVVGTLDPNPQVSGRGVRILKQAGIDTRVGVLSLECTQLNFFYNHWMRTGKPWVILKSASSLDGRVALKNGKSRWISSEKSREWVHQLRSRVDAILVGIGTILADDPLLNARYKQTVRQPVRIVLDASLKISERAKVLTQKSSAPCWLVVGPAAGKSAKAERIIKKNAELIPGPNLAGRLDLKKLLKVLGRKQITSLLVEGGPETWKAFLDQRCADEWVVFIAPKVLGGDAIPLIPKLHIGHLPGAHSFTLQDVEVLENDVLLGYRFQSKKALA